MFGNDKHMYVNNHIFCHCWGYYFRLTRIRSSLCIVLDLFRKVMENKLIYKLINKNSNYGNYALKDRQS